MNIIQLERQYVIKKDIIQDVNGMSNNDVGRIRNRRYIHSLNVAMFAVD